MSPPSFQLSQPYTDQIRLQIPVATQKCLCEKQRWKGCRVKWVNENVYLQTIFEVFITWLYNLKQNLSVSTFGSPQDLWALPFLALCFLGARSLAPWPSPTFTCIWTWREAKEQLQLINHKWLALKGPRAFGRGGGKERRQRPRCGCSLLPHDKICFIYLTATATLLQNPTISHHRAFLQGQLEWGCLATENKAGFHCREHTTAHKIIVYSRPVGGIWLKSGQTKRAWRKKDAKKFVRNKLACAFETKKNF